ncbi:MAG: hypothetical protein D8M58_10570 [Calditrichaeota bacterium]|nr:MAG: hypothetical protein DWQ03_09945 [Calditrichota bacterium]MBL1205834.1 hypothetical protein [Calditrichota bacterium]NOG45661.1 carbohydrate binding family 9 domain-containing protein [Calditrichota bacterium]
MKSVLKINSLLSILIICLAQNLLAQQKEVNSLQAYYTTEEILIDGDIDEDVWEEAPFATDFIQRDLNNGEPATEKTRVAILYDSNNLYIGVWAFDSEPDKIIAKESRRDFSWGSEDNFEIILSPFNDNRNGYLFVVNPNGAMADVLITDEGSGFNKDWNGVWEAAVEIDDEEGWFIEIAIPFSTLKYPDNDEQVWALNMERNIRRKNEQVLWQGWSRNYDLETISHAGKLTGLKNISSQKLWEIKPFISGGAAQEKGGKLKEKFKVGGDINYHVSPKMKLNITFNTDFSQVESDREQINLTRFPLDFPEKRDFFLEGKNLFRFNLGSNAQTFYSRRIGLHNRKEVPIIGGLRLTGKMNNSNIGVMTLQSQSKDNLPSTNYSVARLRQDVLESSNVGFILTSRQDKNESNYVYGADANYSSSTFLGDKNLDVGVAFAQSIIPDKSNSNALGYRAYITSINDFFEYDVAFSRVAKDFDPGIGFLRRKNYKLLATELQFNPRPDFVPFTKNLEIKPFDISYFLNDRTNKIESLNFEWRPFGIELESGDFAEFNIQRFFDSPDSTFEPVDDIQIAGGDYWYGRYEIQVETYSGRPVFSEINYSWGDFYNGQRKQLEMVLGWNLGKLNISADWERNIVNIKRPKTTDEMGARFEYAFSTNLYTTFFGQWNNEDDEALLDFRVNWIPKTGSYFYFVVNQELSTAGPVYVLNTTVLSKLTWLFSF